MKGVIVVQDGTCVRQRWNDVVTGKREKQWMTSGSLVQSNGECGKEVKKQEKKEVAKKTMLKMLRLSMSQELVHLRDGTRHMFWR